MAEAKKPAISKSPAKSMDVAKPGTTAPNTSSKPIIVSNKPQVADSVVKTEAKEEPKLVSHAGLTLQPPSKSVEEQNASEPSKTEPPQEPTTDEGGEVDVLADAVAEKSKKKDEDKAELERLKQVQKLVDQKTYFVKISDGASGSSFTKVCIVLIFLVLLGAVVVNFLLDADMLQLPIKPLTNLL